MMDQNKIGIVQTNQKQVDEQNRTTNMATTKTLTSLTPLIPSEQSTNCPTFDNKSDQTKYVTDYSSQDKVDKDEKYESALNKKSEDPPGRSPAITVQCDTSDDQSFLKYSPTNQNPKSSENIEQENCPAFITAILKIHRSKGDDNCEDSLMSGPGMVDNNEVVLDSPDNLSQNENDCWGSSYTRMKWSRTGFSSEQDLCKRRRMNPLGNKIETKRLLSNSKEKKVTEVRTIPNEDQTITTRTAQSSIREKKINLEAKISSNIISSNYNYIDYSRFPPGHFHVYRPKRGGAAIPFPIRLHYVLTSTKSSLNPCISWRCHGRAFKVNDPNHFAKHTLRECFRQSKMASFQRQLNLYGFRRITKGVDSGSYYHPMFLQHRPDLCMAMKREKIKGSQGIKGTSQDDEPDFYQMEPIRQFEDVRNQIQQNDVEKQKKTDVTETHTPSKGCDVHHSNFNAGEKNKKINVPQIISSYSSLLPMHQSISTPESNEGLS